MGVIWSALDGDFVSGSKGLTASSQEGGHRCQIGWISHRDELLNGEVLDSLAEAKVLVEGRQKEYNRFRPHSSLGYRPPALEACVAAKFTQGLAR